MVIYCLSNIALFCGHKKRLQNFVMTFDESIWIRDRLQELAAQNKGFPLLNVGSSTKHHRQVEQPHIDKNIWQPLEKIGKEVHHLDMKQAEGVDIVGDLTDKSFQEKLKQTKYNGILSSNLLEHVVNPGEIAECMTEIVIDGGYIICTVPHLLQFHKDPIDTYFRPNVEELKSLFPNTEMVRGEILTIDFSLARLFWKRPKQIFFTLIRMALPFYKFNEWKHIASYIPNLFKNYKVTCIVLKKLGNNKNNGQ